VGGFFFPVDGGSSAFCVARFAGGRLTQSVDLVAEEIPVALAYNGISHAVMLATPGDLEDFATGFSLSEAIIGSASDMRDIEVTRSDDGITVDIAIAPERFLRLKARRRNLIRLARKTGVSLVGFARGRNHVVYANSTRVNATAKIVR